MALEMLVREAQGLSEASILEVVHYIRFLKKEESEASYHSISESDTQKRYRNAGKYRGKGWMSEDFDAPIDDLKEYM